MPCDTAAMRPRRVHLGSLLVVALALAGATVVPARDVSRAHSAIVWQAQDIRRALVATMLGPRRVARPTGLVAQLARHTPHTVSPTVRHALFQRPPPVAATRT